MHDQQQIGNSNIHLLGYLNSPFTFITRLIYKNLLIQTFLIQDINFIII